MVSHTVEQNEPKTVGDFCEMMSDIHRENVNLCERMSELEDQVYIALERLNEFERKIKRSPA